MEYCAETKNFDSKPTVSSVKTKAALLLIAQGTSHMLIDTLHGERPLSQLKLLQANVYPTGCSTEESSLEITLQNSMIMLFSSTSKVNYTHVAWIIKQVELFLRADLKGVSKNARNPILAVAACREQVVELKKRFICAAEKHTTSDANRARVPFKKARSALAELESRSNIPGTEYLRHMWKGRFQAFRQDSLETDLSLPPTGSDLELFLWLVPEIIKGQSDGVPTLNTVEVGLSIIKKEMSFLYKEFKLDSHDDARLNATLDQLVRVGRLNGESPLSEKAWVTSDIIGRMVKAMLKDGINKGTISWDILIMKALSLLMQSINAARAGELRRSNLKVT
ncbi:hypothetical protein NW768_006540 [Fusarium equiseti]|uniref:Uncharacterized protein n=1 Tax=Fusarium equiseti TaxID=61235 RepID=A0ABQ8RBR0_FUSEQ|nr:hypothetical protein NW768_006540 [Fusarium equiseti]